MKPLPRRLQACSACKTPHPGIELVRNHCPSPTCTWWRCPSCKAANTPTGANDRTQRDGTPRWPGKAP